MKTFIRRSFAAIICSFLLASQGFAKRNSYLNIPNLPKVGGAEFVSGNQPGTVLMKVNLWGAVNRPGIHHVPVRTDLISLVSYAGGPTGQAILDDVTIKREVGNTRKLIKVDVEELIQGVSHHHVELAPNDIIVIPTDEPLISQDTLAVVGVLSLVASTILAVVYIERNGRR